MSNTRHLVLAAGFAAAIVACGGRDGAYDDTSSLQVDTAAGMAALPQEYTESELLGLTSLSNEGTIALANLAKTKATSAEVKSLATKAVEGHSALDKKGKDLAAQLNLTPMVPSADENLADNQAKWMEELTQKPASQEWDAAYLQYEIERHETILDEVKDALSREQRPEVRAYFEEVRTHIEGHLPEYRRVLDTLRN
jgi:predicted outer membrane protein